MRKKPPGVEAKGKSYRISLTDLIITINIIIRKVAVKNIAFFGKNQAH